jgi:hypothetical protein
MAKKGRLCDRAIQEIIASGAVDQLIGELQEAKRFPKKTNFAVLVSQIRAACEAYSPDLGLSRTQRQREIFELYKAVTEALNCRGCKREEANARYREVAGLFNSLSSLTLREINLRVDRLNVHKQRVWRQSVDAENEWRQCQTNDGLREGHENPRVEPPNIFLPTTDDLGAVERRSAACETLFTLIQYGVEFVDSSKTVPGGGLRSWQALAPHLLAPETASGQKRRLVKDLSPREIDELIGWKTRVNWAPEKALIGGLRLAWWEATGDLPALTAKRYNSDGRVGPFATLVECLLELFCVKGVNVVNLLNQMALDRRMESDRQERRRSLPRVPAAR